jgi:hypothetical protein
VEVARTRLAPSRTAAALPREEALRQFEALVTDFHSQGFRVANRGLVVASPAGAVVEMSGGRVSRYESAEVRCYALGDEPSQCGCVDDAGTAE